jgi:hypothetical protein
MRSEKDRKRSHSASVARGRMYLNSDLAWLPGFPLHATLGAVEWMSVPRGGNRTPEPIRLERDHLHRASYVRTKLVHKFPNALPLIVDDYDRWIEGVPEVLDLLKEAIHHGRELPPALLTTGHGFSRSSVREAGLLTKTQPALRSLVNALSWTLYLTPRELPKALSWLQENAPVITVLLSTRPGPDGVVSALILWELVRRDGPGRVQSPSATASCAAEPSHTCCGTTGNSGGWTCRPSTYWWNWNPRWSCRSCAAPAPAASVPTNRKPTTPGAHSSPAPTTPWAVQSGRNA